MAWYVINAYAKLLSFVPSVEHDYMHGDKCNTFVIIKIIYEMLESSFTNIFTTILREDKILYVFYNHTSTPEKYVQHVARLL